MRLHAWLGAIILLAAMIFRPEGGNAAAQDDNAQIKVTVTAVLTANGHFSDGTANAADDIKITLTETSTFSFKDGSRKVISSQHHVAVEGKGKLVLGEDLPTPKWTYVPDKQDPNGYSFVDLRGDGSRGVFSLRNFSDTVKMLCELPEDGLTAPYPIAPMLAIETFRDYAIKHPIGDNNLELRIPFAFPPSSGARNISGQTTHDYTDQLGKRGKGKLMVSYIVSRGAPVAVEEKTSQLKAVPIMSSSVQRGETLILDGTKSTGNIQEYTWNFKSKAVVPGGESPNEKAEKKGAKSSVVLLDSMDVTLTVSDGNKIDKKTVTVTVKPRSYFRTHFEHVPGEGALADGSCPKCVWTGKDAKNQKTYYGEWIGGENVCAIDPPAAGVSEVPHIFHPKLEKAGKDEAYIIEVVNDPQGPWNDYSYFKDWKIEIKRQTRVNKFIQEQGPPCSGVRQNFYQGNLARSNDVKGYLAAVRKHEYQHSELMAKALGQVDPAKDTEKSWGKDRQKLKAEADKRIREAEKKLHDQSKDPLELLWKGNLAVPEMNTGDWRTFEVPVGGPGYGSF